MFKWNIALWIFRVLKRLYNIRLVILRFHIFEIVDSYKILQKWFYILWWKRDWCYSYLSLIDCLIDRLTDWLTKCTTNWMASWLASWLTAWITDWLTVWLTVWLITRRMLHEWLTDRLRYKLNERLTDAIVGWQANDWVADGLYG